MLTGVGQVDPCHLRQDGRIYAGDLFGQPEVVRQDEVAGHRARRSGVALVALEKASGGVNEPLVLPGPLDLGRERTDDESIDARPADPRDGFGLLPGLLTDVELRNGCGKQVRVRASKHHRNPSNACQYAARISLAPQAFGSTTPQYQSERLTGSASS
jgi:hypothetical protein